MNDPSSPLSASAPIADEMPVSLPVGEVREIVLPKLLSEVYRESSPLLRAGLLQCLLRPVTPLGLVAVALRRGVARRGWLYACGHTLDRHRPPMTLPFDPAAFAQRQLDAYNARDLERFVREYTEDVEVFRLPDARPFITGKAALAAHYRENRFHLSGLHAKLVNRMVFGNKVIDQEFVTGVPGAPLEVAAIYEVGEGGIRRVWFVGRA